MHVNNFLYKNESPNLRRVCAPDSELPSYTCTMSYSLTAVPVFSSKRSTGKSASLFAVFASLVWKAALFEYLFFMAPTHRADMS